MTDRPEHNVCGYIPTHRKWRTMATRNLTAGERVCRFAERYCLVPEGQHVGKPIKLDKFQVDFILAIYDNPHKTRRAILSIARKNGKTALIAILLIVHLCGSMRKLNSQLISGAMSRDQAALVYSLASKMIALNPALSRLLRCIPSSKRIISASNGSEFKALAADGKTAHGLSPILAILDELGQARGASNPFIEAITTSQGAHAEPLLIVISTQAASDADILSLWIDDARRSQDPHTICHVYAADQDCELLDDKQWAKANPSLGKFRSKKDLEEQLKMAARIPANEASARNLLLNQRISQNHVWLAPSLWKENNRAVNLDLFKTRVVHIGLDLSMRNDLTAAVLTTDDDEGYIHCLPFVFIPEDNLEIAELRDKAPYRAWARAGLIFPVQGKTIDYEWVATFMREVTKEMIIGSLCFDRWGIEGFKQASAYVGFDAIGEWQPVGQGFRDFSPRMKALEVSLLQGKIAHGNHPVLNMAVQNAISVIDKAANIKLDKASSSLRIDPLVALVMAAYPLLDGRKDTIFSLDRIIG